MADLGGSAMEPREHPTAPGWRKTRAGLGWVLCALFFMALPGFIGLAKAICARSGVELPNGDGTSWVSIPDYINAPGPNTFTVSKQEMLDIVAYGVPSLLAAMLLFFGRLTCGAAPSVSGAKGMFIMSGLFTMLGVAVLFAAIGATRLYFEEIARYTSVGFLILAGTAEFWFLTGLAVTGVALKRPRTAKSVAFLGFVVALLAAAATLGWDIYAKEYRPKVVDADWKLYEQGGFTLSWFLLIVVYWRTVGSARRAISEHLESTGE